MTGMDQSEQLRGPFPSAGARGSERDSASSASIGELVGRLPRLFIELVRSEIEYARREMIGKRRSYGIAVGLFAGAALFLVTVYALLVTALVVWLVTMFELWAAVLIVAALCLPIGLMLGLLGYRSLKRASGLKPEQTLKNLRQDWHAMRGLGRYE